MDTENTSKPSLTSRFAHATIDFFDCIVHRTGDCFLIGLTIAGMTIGLAELEENSREKNNPEATEPTTYSTISINDSQISISNDTLAKGILLASFSSAGGALGLMAGTIGGLRRARRILKNGPLQ